MEDLQTMVCASSQENVSSGFATRYDSNRLAQLQKLASLESLSNASINIILSKEQTTKMLMIQGGHPHADTKFPDFSLTKFNFSLTKILRFYYLFVFPQPINDKFPVLVH